MNFRFAFAQMRTDRTAVFVFFFTAQRKAQNAESVNKYFRNRPQIKSGKGKKM